MDEMADVPERGDFTVPGVGLACAVLYVVGIGLAVVGSVGAFVWGPLLWCVAVGFVVIAVSFAIGGGRF